TMVVAGWQQEEEEQVEIEVDEGYDEIVIPEEEQPDEDLVTTYPQNKSTVTTNVNNESSIEFEVEPRSVKRCDRVMTIRLKLSAEGYFEEELDISTFKFRASEKEESEKPFNGVEFQTRYTQIDKGERWPPDEQQTGSAMVGPGHFAHDGYDLDSNEFSVETMLYWEIDSENIGEEVTLQLEAIVGGLSEDVPATVDICLEGSDV
ncbi:MAG: hypothetical protein ACOC53_08175, partial [Candidatus Saliniplasma sp.]